MSKPCRQDSGARCVRGHMAPRGDHLVIQPRENTYTSDTGSPDGALRTEPRHVLHLLRQPTKKELAASLACEEMATATQPRATYLHVCLNCNLHILILIYTIHQLSYAELSLYYKRTGSEAFVSDQTAHGYCFSQGVLSVLPYTKT